MKQLLVIASAILLTVSACKKDDKTKPTETPVTTPVITPEFSFLVDGVKITIDSTVATVDTINHRMTIAGYSAGNMRLYFYAPAEAGTKDPATDIDLYYYTVPTDTAYYATSGHFNISTFDLPTNKIIGTFDFSAIDDDYSTGLVKAFTAGNIYITNLIVGGAIKY
jgi:hypothetical protein